MTTLTIVPGKLTLADWRKMIEDPQLLIKLSVESYQAIDDSCAAVKKVLAQEQTVYGINTGFGLLANTKISHDELETLQRSIVLSHAAGIGKSMCNQTVRLIMALKINSLARGFSGVRREVIDNLITLFNKKIYPIIPEKGSVGASGDLAPLAHMSLLLIGEGTASVGEQIISGAEALKLADLSPLVLGPKEGLALLNGTQVSTALALRGLFAAENLFSAAVVCGSLSVEACLASRVPFDPRIHAIRGHAGQIDVAKAYMHLFAGKSELNDSHIGCEKVQDPYSLRCQPQVMGACLTQIRHSADTLLIEANAVSDNPLVFSHDGDILSGGNFHGEPVAFAADNLALAFAEIGAQSERRIALLIDSKLSGLPPFLVNQGGINSGFMIAQVTAAALASENKTYAHPASVDSMPTSANQEDHVSMATFAARRLGDMAENTSGILAVELLAACQGLDFRQPLRSSPKLEQAKKRLRNRVPFYEKDRYFAPDIIHAVTLVSGGEYNSFMPTGLLPSL